MNVVDLRDWTEPFWGDYAVRREAFAARRRAKPQERQFLLDYITPGLAYWPSVTFET